jgi:hypothetical protein
MTACRLKRAKQGAWPRGSAVNGGEARIVLRSSDLEAVWVSLGTP